MLRYSSSITALFTLILQWANSAALQNSPQKPGESLQSNVKRRSTNHNEFDPYVSDVLHEIRNDAHVGETLVASAVLRRMRLVGNFYLSRTNSFFSLGRASSANRHGGTASIAVFAFTELSSLPCKTGLKV